MSHHLFPPLPVILSFIFLLALPTSAQHQLTLRSLEVSPEITARQSQYSRTDANKRMCALIKVYLPVEGCSFKGDIIGATTYDRGEYWVYVTENTKRLTIYCPGLEPSDIVWQTQPGNNGVRSGGTYVLKVDGYESSAPAVSTAETHSCNGHEWVDLGLSVKWATCNVGADKPEDYGDYFAWGETTTKSSYDEGNCKTWEKDMGDITGNSRYDAARATWGDYWRMPTEKEAKELVDNCIWEWTTQGTTKGCQITSKVNGNSIFLPAAGTRRYSSLKDTGEYGVYWTSTPYSYPFYDTATNILVFKDSICRVEMIYRQFGYAIRPVIEIIDQVGSNPYFHATHSLAKGNDAHREGKYNEAAECYRVAAEYGISEAQLKLGNCYLYGRGVAMNEVEARRWYEQAARQDDDWAKLAREKREECTSSYINGHRYVDLGLSVKWATCNVGADSPEAYGNYFKWGVTTPYAEDVDGKRDYKKDIAGKKDADAARANWGGPWRMPTEAEMEELFNKCNWVPTLLPDGTQGYTILSWENDASIFLPAAGKHPHYGEEYISTCYWTSTPNNKYSTVAIFLYADVYRDLHQYGGIRGEHRSRGLSIRPVTN